MGIVIWQIVIPQYVVCLGNIADLQLQKRYFGKKIKNSHLTVDIDSAGTMGHHAGSPLMSELKPWVRCAV